MTVTTDPMRRVRMRVERPDGVTAMRVRSKAYPLCGVWSDFPEDGGRTQLEVTAGAVDAVTDELERMGCRVEVAHAL